MVEICVKVPEEWRQEIEKSGDTSLVIRFLLKRELQERARLRSIVSKSKLSERDVRELSDKIDKSISERFKQSLR